MKRLRFAALGAALAYFLDPQNGSERRKRAVKRLAALANRSRQPELTDELVGEARKAQEPAQPAGEPAPAHE
jgi:hypothetical protein